MTATAGLVSSPSAPLRSTEVPRTVDEVPAEDLDGFIAELKDQVTRREAARAGLLVQAGELHLIAEELRARIEADVEALDALEVAIARSSGEAARLAERAEQEWTVLAMLRARRALIGRAAA